MTRRIALLVCLLAAAGCVAEKGALRRDLEADDPRTQMAAVARIACERRVEAVPALVDLLASEDEGVRFAAEAALRRITGQHFGASYARTEARREERVEAWRTWLRAEGYERLGIEPPPEKPETPGNEAATDEPPGVDDEPAETPPAGDQEGQP